MRKHRCINMAVPKFAPTKRMVIATVMVAVVAIVMLVSFVWGPASV